MATGTDNLWRLCADWLTRCKIIPPEHKANAEDSEIKVNTSTKTHGLSFLILLNLFHYYKPKLFFAFNLMLSL